MPRRFRTVISGLVLAALTAVVGVFIATPAQAASHYGCSYPNVCLNNGSYNGGTKIWQAWTPAYLILPEGDRNVADSVINTKNDDSVWLLDTGVSPDRYLCIPADTYVNLGSYAHPARPGTWAGDVDAVVIFPSSDNGLCSGSDDVRGGSVPDGWRPSWA
ncbi:hypothetical protein ACFWQC_22615 [Nocardioides sp. NPDC058538]|uniref:hypothetical protein n=1 Tax=Nocardioides sp. NPDC058538 TaxID=3346542 RepID=UPI0036582A6A